MQSTINLESIPDLQNFCQCGCGTPIEPQTKGGKPRQFVLGHNFKIHCPKKLKNLSNKQYGQLVVIKLAPESTPKHGKWICTCDCGNTCTIRSDQLTRGITTSCPQCGRKRQRAIITKPDRQQVAFLALYNSYRCGAKDRNYAFELTLDECIPLFLSACRYCGREPYAELKTGYKPTQVKIKYMGIDRVDNTVGYILSNVISCCKECNFAKRDMTFESFINMCRLVTNHNRSGAQHGITTTK